MDALSLALDWTPNINHIGFFVALEKGYYRDAGLNVKIIDPRSDNYETTPAKKVELGEADFALCPTESIISYRTKSEPFDLIAIAAILKEDLSAIAVRSGEHIRSPKDLDGRSYASYQARYEDGIVKEMIRNAGGKGELDITYPEKLGIWDTLLSHAVDSTWVFLNWEGVEAEGASMPFEYFKMADFEIPYAYSPVIAASEQLVHKKRDAYQRFLQATKRGYLFCQEEPLEAIEILETVIPEKDKHIDLQKALAKTAPAFGNEANWGIMEEKAVRLFLNWIKEKGLEEHAIDLENLLSNAGLT